MPGRVVDVDEVDDVLLEEVLLEVVLLAPPVSALSPQAETKSASAATRIDNLR